MDAKAYLKKVNKICKVYENRGQCNEACPLKKYGCGTPLKESDIEDAIKVIGETEEILYPFGKCKKCDKEFNSELISEYNITHCPWCGESI
jgi:DNA-directed RNA polymerase subunit RPC12/RpoP